MYGESVLVSSCRALSALKRPLNGSTVSFLYSQHLGRYPGLVVSLAEAEGIEPSLRLLTGSGLATPPIAALASFLYFGGCRETRTHTPTSVSLRFSRPLPLGPSLG